MMLLFVALLTLSGGMEREIDLAEMQKKGLLKGGTLDSSSRVLHIANTKGKKTVPLFTLNHPPVTSRTYFIRGQLRYKGVASRSYLEMMSHFPGQRRYFSRTLAGRGPTAAIVGDSPWREVVLPFDLGPNATMRPTALDVSMVFFSQGEVWLRNLVFIDGIPATPAAIKKPGPKPWWSKRAGGWIGMVWGTLFGVFGVVSALLIQKGRAKRFVYVLMAATALLGLIATVAGIFGFYKDQPQDVYFPVLVVGVISMILAPIIFTYAKQRYTELELRKMKSRDMK